MNILELINYGSNKLKIESIPSHKLDSEILLSKVLGINREQVLINLDQKIKTENIIKFNKLSYFRMHGKDGATTSQVLKKI